MSRNFGVSNDNATRDGRRSERAYEMGKKLGESAFYVFAFVGVVGGWFALLGAIYGG